MAPLALALLASLAPTASLTPQAMVVARWPAEEASQGVVADARHFYAIGNNVIGKYDRRDGRRVARWEGDRALFPHINSCTIDGADLVCAASNYPAVPMASTIELIDRKRLRHRRTLVLPPLGGSLTWIERRGADWWAGIANYDGRGGEPGRDHRFTALLRLDSTFAIRAAYRFPDALLDRFAPSSCSGGSWGADGMLYVTGHDKPELYALRLPKAGATLEWVGTSAIASEGQAIAWDRTTSRTLWSIGRARREVIVSVLPELGAAAPGGGR